MILIIYGGAKGFDQTRLDEMKSLLVGGGYCAASFDFRGIAPFTGNFEESGLRSRIEDAQAVLDELALNFTDYTFTILGVSMGGCVGSFLLKNRGVENAVLVAPAAYHDDAIEKNICFNERFTELIRAEGSWKNSRSFEEVANFAGSLLLFQFKHDAVVPHGITQRYYDAATTPDKEVIVLPCPHNGTFEPPKLYAVTNAALMWMRGMAACESPISQR